jgi:hypothetical protein
MAKQPQGELVVVPSGFDYALIEGEGVAEWVRSSADKIRQLVRRSLEDVIRVGEELLSVKEALPHGQFLK